VKNKKCFRRHLGLRRIITYPKIKTFYSAVPQSKIHEFLCKKSSILNFSAILNFYEKKFEQLAKFKQSWRNSKKKLTQVLTSILSLGAILKFHSWQHSFYFLNHKKSIKDKKRFGHKCDKKNLKKLVNKNLSKN
jgi:hypothetical protein